MFTLIENRWISPRDYPAHGYTSLRKVSYLDTLEMAKEYAPLFCNKDETIEVYAEDGLRVGTYHQLAGWKDTANEKFYLGHGYL